MARVGLPIVCVLRVGWGGGVWGGSSLKVLGSSWWWSSKPRSRMGAVSSEWGGAPGLGLLGAGGSSLDVVELWE